MMMVIMRILPSLCNLYAKLDEQFGADLRLVGFEVPIKEDWDNVERLVEFLQHFCKITKKVSGY